MKLNKLSLMFLLLLTTLLFTVGGCAKDDLNELPPATQTGANTFGCKINGVVYKCSGYWDIRSVIAWSGVAGNYGDGRVAIYALVAKNEIHDSWQTRILFDCSENVPDIYRENIKYGNQSPMESYDNKVEITRFDNEVIAGTFQMKVQFDDDDVPYEITEGRFDIKRNN